MPCYHPLDAWQTIEGDIHFHARGTSGKKGNAPNYRRELKLPCGRCIGCRLDRSKQWAIRLMHEAQLHERTAFITLTYADRYVQGGSKSLRDLARPPDPLTRTQACASDTDRSPLACQDSLTRPSSSYVLVRPRSLDYKHVQTALRSLRQTLRRRRGLQGKIRFFMCGEYGEQLARPHYHLALFGEDFREDRYVWRRTDAYTYYRSPELEKHWPHGHSEIGNLTIESAAYIARYIFKKLTGPPAADHYQGRTPEFIVMSRRPGIGKTWFEKYIKDVYPHDGVYINNHKCKPPRYYDKLLELVDKPMLEEIQQAREAGHNHADNTPARLAAREAVTKASLALKRRTYET